MISLYAVAAFIFNLLEVLLLKKSISSLRRVSSVVSSQPLASELHLLHFQPLHWDTCSYLIRWVYSVTSSRAHVIEARKGWSASISSWSSWIQQVSIKSKSHVTNMCTSYFFAWHSHRHWVHFELPESRYLILSEKVIPRWLVFRLHNYSLIMQLEVIGRQS